VCSWQDGVEFPVEISLSTVEIHGKTFIWSAIRSISDRERAVTRLLVELNKRGTDFRRLDLHLCMV
jgi:hypothetical protein